jgi:N-acetylglucosamine-6-phosphate deacetylase
MRREIRDVLGTRLRIGWRLRSKSKKSLFLETTTHTTIDAQKVLETPGCVKRLFPSQARLFPSQALELGWPMSLRLRGRIAGSPEPVEVLIEGHCIQRIGNPSPDSRDVLGNNNCRITPAFFDIQVNGFAGVDFNSASLRPDDLHFVISKLGQKGVAFFCPTVITHSFQHLSACLQAIAQACQDRNIARAIPAIHLEGPFLSREDGPRGAHPVEHIRKADWEEFQWLQESAEGRIGMMTLAPEVPGALRLTEKLSQAGIIVAIGHTAAEPKLIRDAVHAGAKTSTHLGNGSHLKIPRHHNYIWEQLACDELSASFIVDGHHLPPSVVKCMLRAKGCERSILTSDAISAAGMPPGEYKLGEAKVMVHSDYRVERVDLAGTGILAGSALDLLRGVENVMKFAGVTLEEAVGMASLNPAELFGIPHQAGIVPGREANLLVLEESSQDRSLALKYTIMAGEVAFAA